MKRLSLLAVTISTLLAGCGGGGSDGDEQLFVPENSAPVFGEYTLKNGVFEQFFELQFTATDKEGDDLVFSAQNLPEGLIIDGATGLVYGELDNPAFYDDQTKQSRTYRNIIVSVSDGAFTTNTDPFELTFSVEQSPPTIIAEPYPTVDVGQEYSFEIVASDPNGDDLRFSAENLPSWLELDEATGIVSGTPTEIGVHENIILSVSDGYYKVSTDPLVIEVQDPTYVSFAGSLFQFSPELDQDRLFGPNTLVQVEVDDEVVGESEMEDPEQFTVGLKFDETMSESPLRVIYQGTGNYSHVRVESHFGTVSEFLALANENDDGLIVTVADSPKLSSSMVNAARTVLMENAQDDSSESLGREELFALHLDDIYEIASLGAMIGSTLGEGTTWIEQIGSKNSYDALRYFVSGDQAERIQNFKDLVVVDLNHLSRLNAYEEELSDNRIGLRSEQIVGKSILVEPHLPKAALSSGIALEVFEDNTAMITGLDGRAIDVALWATRGDEGLILLLDDKPIDSFSASTHNTVNASSKVREILGMSLYEMLERMQMTSDSIPSNISNISIDRALEEIRLVRILDSGDNNDSPSIYQWHDDGLITISWEAPCLSDDTSEDCSEGGQGYLDGSFSVSKRNMDEVGIPARGTFVMHRAPVAMDIESGANFVIPSMGDVNLFCDSRQMNYESLEFVNGTATHSSGKSYDYTMTDYGFELTRYDDEYGDGGHERIEITPMLHAFDGTSTFVHYARYETEYSREVLKDMQAIPIAQVNNTLALGDYQLDLPSVWNIAQKKATQSKVTLGYNGINNVHAFSLTSKDSGYFGIRGYDGGIPPENWFNIDCVDGSAPGFGLNCYSLSEEATATSFGDSMVIEIADAPTESWEWSSVSVGTHSAVMLATNVGEKASCAPTVELKVMDKFDLSVYDQAWFVAEPYFTW